MSLSKEELQKIRTEVYEETQKLIDTVKRLHGFDNLSLGSQIKVLDQIQEGFWEAIECHKPDGTESPG